MFSATELSDHLDMTASSQELSVVVDNQKVYFNSLLSVNRPLDNKASGYIAFNDGQEVGPIWNEKNAPDVDQRYLGATTLLTGRVLD